MSHLFFTIFPLPNTVAASFNNYHLIHLPLSYPENRAGDICAAGSWAAAPGLSGGRGVTTNLCDILPQHLLATFTIILGKGRLQMSGDSWSRGSSGEQC
ncbi:Olfactory Receptor 6A2 [Manis pentadactyla]|nr:Olfactory Receptor 6A2 [Manis pentadactyla]